ncbi:MAG TPA: Ig-like domain repeat protein [Acidobacteriaceae bacterium]|nr:Ig-like domain repeat protein [Acidobacteriaceae bacterium]
MPLVLPSAIAFDSQGNMYVADAGAHVVREVSAAGAVSVIAGSGVQGFAGDGGPAIDAQLDSPMGLTVDAGGNLYVSDTHNNRVRRIAAGTAVITTLAGTGASGYAGDGGPAMVSVLSRPTALAVDMAGNLYVCDSSNHRIRRIAAASGVITTVAGNGVEGFSGNGGAATSAALDLPYGIAVDGDENLYIGDSHNGRIRRVSAATGVITTVAGNGVPGFGGDGGAAGSAALALPKGVTVDSNGNLYVADTRNHRVRCVSPAGVITTIAGDAVQGFTGDGIAAPTASLDSPSAVSLSTAGEVTIVDAGNRRVRQIDLTSGDIETLPRPAASAPTLTLTGPAATEYGTGTFTAALTGAPGASGTVAIEDTTGGTAIPVGTAALGANGTVSWPTTVLPAGTHVLVAAFGSLSSTPLTVTVTKAITLTTLAVSATTVAPGTSVLLTPQTASTTQGVPTGTVTLSDGTTVLGTVVVGNAFSVASLSSGTHSLTATYAGDANFLPSSSAAATVAVVTASSDFTLASAGSTTQTIAAGTAATFPFNVTMQGAALASPILLAVQGVPAGATASLSPASLPPGGSVTTFALTIQTPQAAVRNNQHGIMWALLLIPASMWRRARRTGFRLAILSGSCILLGLLPTGCGDRTNQAAGQSHTSTYTITVTGTATGPSGSALQHSANITLEVY